MSRASVLRRLLAGLVLGGVTFGLTVLPAEGAAAGDGRITLRELNAVVVGHTWSVRGKLTNTGSRNNKTVTIEWRDGGAWKQVGIKRRQDDGPYRLSFSSSEVGVSKLRAKVFIHGRFIDKSRARTLTVLSDTPQISPQPADPGEAGIASNLVMNGGTQTMGQFLDAVLGDVHGYWARVWASAGWSSPTVYRFWPAPGEAFYHACNPQGTYVEDRAAAYCPANDYIVISQYFATELWLGAFNISGVEPQRAGDFSVAYVVAHEYGHNIQAELGWTPYRSSIPTRSWELHADCLAGNWMNSAYYSGRLQAGDIEEALGAARQLGDWVGDHGTPEERATAVWYGYSTGDPSACEGYIRQWW